MSDSLTGKLLVASTLAENPIQARSVCLVVHQDEHNVIAVMLNRPITPSPDALIAMLNDHTGEDTEAGPSEQPSNRLADYQSIAPDQSPQDQSPQSSPGGTIAGMLHFGGPRSGPVVAIHQTSEFAEAEPGDGIYVAAQKEHLQELVREQPAPYRLIVGHLGWAADELLAEIEAGMWHVIPATTETVFSAADLMWPQLIRRATSSSVARWIGTTDVIGAGDLN